MRWNHLFYKWDTSLLLDVFFENSRVNTFYLTIFRTNVEANSFDFALRTINYFFLSPIIEWILLLSTGILPSPVVMRPRGYGGVGPWRSHPRPDEEHTVHQQWQGQAKSWSRLHEVSTSSRRYFMVPLFKWRCWRFYLSVAA